LFITVLHKKHPKSFVSNFWGAVQIGVAFFYSIIYNEVVGWNRRFLNI
jgi:hypothetical protein